LCLELFDCNDHIRQLWLAAPRRVWFTHIILLHVGSFIFRAWACFGYRKVLWVLTS
jgi:hypothetical protein